MPNAPFILASRSPRRVELLRDAGYDFEIDPADVDEENLPPGLSPVEVATYLARIKAEEVARRHPTAVVLGADTVVAVGTTLYGKADTPADAHAMLAALAGRDQRVITGVCVMRQSPHRQIAEASIATVTMRPMTDAEIDAYVASDQWRGKAGAYGIQDLDPDADPFARLSDGEFSTVVGLPMTLARRLLGEFGIASSAV